MFPHKDGHFRLMSFGGNMPKTPEKGVNRYFQAKMLKSKNRKISETTCTNRVKSKF